MDYTAVFGAEARKKSDCNAALFARKVTEMTLEERHFTLLWDGELDNGPELEAQFSVKDPGKLVILAYAKWNTAFLQHLEGHFALTLWDGQNLLFARDPLGAKSMFYSQKGESLFLSTRISSLLDLPELSHRVDAQGVGELLLLGPGRTPGNAIFREISELKPGYFGLWNGKTLKIRQYWTLFDAPCTDSFPQACGKVRALVLEKLSRKIPKQGSFCCFLSGGLDSSILSAAASREAGSLHTVSVDYRDNEHFFQPGIYQPSADGPYISEMVRSIHSRHSIVTLESGDLLEHLDAACEARGFPGMADVDASLYCLSRHTREPVAISGECADELFGGYPWFQNTALGTEEGFPWSRHTEYRSSFLLPQDREALHPAEFVRNRWEEALQNVPLLPNQPEGERRKKEMTVLNVQWFMQTLMERNRRMSGKLSIRTPFCDPVLLQYVYGLPWEYLSYGGREKGLLREAFRDFLPEKVRNRKKSPYPKTWDPAYLTAVSRRLEDILSQKNHPIFDFVDRKALESLRISPENPHWYGQLMQKPQTIGYFLQLAHWLTRFRVSRA